MNLELASLSADLRRISYWLYYGRLGLVREVVKKIKPKYKNISSVGVYANVWDEIMKICDGKEENARAADRAATLGSIFLQESYKVLLK